MKHPQQLLLIICLGALLLLQSCFISRQPQHDLRNLDRGELYAMRTVHVPMFIARPALKIHLKNEHHSKELRSYVNSFKAMQVTIAATRSCFNIDEFSTMVTKAPYQNWVTVNAYGNRVYINAAEKNNVIRKVNIVAAAKDNGLVYVTMKCKLSPDDLSHFISLLLSDEESINGWMEEISSHNLKREL